MPRLLTGMLAVALVACSAKRGAEETDAVSQAPAPSAAPVAPDAQHAEALPPLPDDWTGTEAEYAMFRAMSRRHGEPDCASLDAMTQTPVKSLTFLAEEVPLPPWVALHAAACLASRHAQDAKGTLRSWVVDPKFGGLAIMVLERTDGMEAELAKELVSTALSGPHAAEAAEVAEVSAHPEVRALVPSTP